MFAQTHMDILWDFGTYLLNTTYSCDLTHSCDQPMQDTACLKNAQPLTSRTPIRLSQYSGSSNDVSHAETRRQSPSILHARASFLQSGSARALGLQSAASSVVERQGHSSVTNGYSLGSLLRSGGQEPLFTVSSAAERNRAQALGKATR